MTAPRLDLSKIQPTLDTVRQKADQVRAMLDTLGGAVKWIPGIGNDVGIALTVMDALDDSIDKLDDSLKKA